MSQTGARKSPRMSKLMMKDLEEQQKKLEEETSKRLFEESVKNLESEASVLHIDPDTGLQLYRNELEGTLTF